MMTKRIASMFGILILMMGCTSIPEGLKAVKDFEPGRYMGRWYEIARLDHSFERHLSNVSAVYTILESGDIQVKNAGFNTKTGEWKEILGHARFLDQDTVGSLKVSFFGPFYGGYHIIALDRKNYHYAMVAGPSRSYLWILSRSPYLEEAVYSKLISQAREWGFDTTQLIRVKHDKPDAQKQIIHQDINAVGKGEDKMITPCPSTPNCVSSLDKGRKSYIEPLTYAGSEKDARKRLLKVLSLMKRTRVKKSDENYIHAESVSAIMRFVDDVEFFFDVPQKVIQVKSASRTGYSDFGVNRRRIEKIRKLFYERK
jgi:apolipoprotein D and lipocalin family protein